MALELDFGFPSGLFDFEVDNLVDDTLTNTDTLFDDCNYGVVQMQKTEEKSPFHESDSGVSDVSDFSGDKTASPAWEMDIPMLDEILDIPTGPFVGSGCDSGDEYISQDQDLIKYLQSGTRSNEQTVTVTVDSELTKRVTVSQTSRPVTRSQAAGAVKGHNPQPDVDISFQANGSRSVNGSCAVGNKKNHYHDSTSEDECEFDVTDSGNPVVSRQKPKGSVRVKQAGVKLPSTNNSEKSNVTSVKVLRIVQSGSEGNTEDDIAKALEERNRKNAEMARQNRLKKKAYVGNLELEVEDGRKRIDELEAALNSAEEERDSYKREVEYLKSVLANQSALAGLLKNIPSVEGVTLSSSASRKRMAEHDHSYTPKKKSRACGQSASSKPGVCLHVNSDNVSLEFCHHCAKMAREDIST